MQVTIEIAEGFVMPSAPIATPAAYLAAVLNNAVQSWKVHLGADTVEDACAAALAEFNAQFAPADDGEA